VRASNQGETGWTQDLEQGKKKGGDSQENVGGKEEEEEEPREVRKVEELPMSDKRSDTTLPSGGQG